ncbi:HAMP domain-containing histidine kinase [Amycolatopsis acidicola]|uniref:histidine kinase n=1 Tax=Amycolatopsis acidicola TaxID=2596893 RepID=A0A5N0V6V7_9PSEU|nr:HAMP domain-containing sensor histidine kinase [Amycolatopsis acidicola]KAA9160242.1 HAMP domain-containing histidine kinase [Amycolatopsis acidicola]
MRKRIVALTIAAAVLAISLFGLPLAAGVAKYFVDDQWADLERAADSAALQIADTLADNPGSLQLPGTHDHIDLAVYAPDGRLLAGNGPATADQIVGEALSGKPAQDDLDLAYAIPVTDGGALVGVVRTATSNLALYSRIGLAWLVMLGLAVAALALTWLVSRWLAARLARPLEELSATARRLGEGDFTVRAGRVGVPEIDSVATSLDTTAERIGDTLGRERAFSANASHQLRTPLAGLRLQLESVLDVPEADARGVVQDAVETVDRLERTVDDLLTLARGRPRASEPADLTALLTEVEQDWRGLLAAEGRELRVVREDPPAPWASEEAIRQILVVLLDNALRHGQGAVEVVARDFSGVLAVDVGDQGSVNEDGMALFARRGNGIGLALARSLAEAEGGRLSLARPSPTKFTLHLPCDDPGLAVG